MSHASWGALVAAVAVLGSLVVAPTAQSAKYPFAFGTYKGKLSTGGAMSIRLRQATCHRRRQYVIPTKGACLRVNALEIEGGACPDGTTVEPTLGAYLRDREEIHLARSGKYSDVADTSYGVGRTITTTTFKFQAKGRRITGTIKITGSQENDLSIPCATVSATFTLKLPKA